jgi:MFS family permease
MGLTGGIWNARIPAAKSQVHLSDGTLGLALFAVPIGLVVGAALAERLVDRMGSALLARICGIGSCATIMTPGLAGTLPELMAALLVVGVFFGVVDVATNSQGVRVEGAYGRPVMTSMHAFFSLGAILGALAGAAFAWVGVGLFPSLAAVGAAGLLIDVFAGRWLLPGTGRPETTAAAPNEHYVPVANEPDVPVVNEPDVPVPDESGVPVPDEPAVPRPAPDARQVRRLVLVLGLLSICALVGEGAAGDWSAVYLKDNLGTSAGFAALGFSAFSALMTLGRAVGDRLIHRLGVVPVIRVCGLTATAGLALALATPVPALAIAGFTVFGAGLSVVAPQVFAAGGRADPARPGSGLAKVVGLGYTGQTAGPAIIGLVADRIGLHLALFIPVALAAWIAVAAPVLARAGRPAGPPRGPGGNGRPGVTRNRSGYPRRAPDDRSHTLSTWTTKRSWGGSAR